MEIFVDDAPVDAGFIDRQSLGDALRTVQTEFCPEGRWVVHVRCDGRDVSSQDMTDALLQRAADFDRLELFTATRGALVRDAMTEASRSLDQTEGECRRAGELLSVGKASEGIAAFGECLRVWQQIHDAVSKTIHLLELNPDEMIVEGEPLNALLAKPKDILLQVKQALETQDLVLLADLLLYDFDGVTRQWHAMVALLLAEADES